MLFRRHPKLSQAYGAGNIQLLRLNLGANRKAQKRLQTAAFPADRGAKLSAQLLAFARRQPLKPVATSLGRILRNMDDLLRRALGEPIEGETVVTSGLWTAMVDPNQQSISARKPAFKSYAPEATPTTEATLRILVVEDNEDAQIMLCELLMVLGHHACGVPDAEAALAALGTEDYDVLLTDVNLPGMSGIALARQVLAATPSMKIIFSSGYGAVSANEFGMPCASLPKPYDLEKLQSVLKSVVTAG